MKHRTLLVVTATTLATAPLAAGIASATPGAGVQPPVVHAAGALLPDGVHASADGIKLQTKDPSAVSVVTLTLEPGGTTGWHSHPGVAVIAVTEGVGELYSADCSSQTFRAGQAFVETGDDAPTVFRNEGQEQVVLTVTFLAPEGAAVGRDEANPGCRVS